MALKARAGTAVVMLAFDVDEDGVSEPAKVVAGR